MPTKIYINTNADSPSVAAVRSELQPTAVKIPDVVVNDKTDFSFGLVDGNGSFDTATAADVAILNVGVGPMGGPALTSTTAWTYASNSFAGYLDFSLSAVTLALGVEAYLDLFMEAQITSNATSHAHTCLQAPVKLLNRVNS